MKITIETFGTTATGSAVTPTLSVEGIKVLSKSESRAIKENIEDFLEKYTDKSPLSL